MLHAKSKLGGKKVRCRASPLSGDVVDYMERTNDYFEDQVKTPLRDIFAHIRGMRNYAVTSNDLQENHQDLVEEIKKIDEEVWKVIQGTQQTSRRLKGQLLKVKKKTAPGPRPSGRPSKSIKRQEAGKLKAASLTLWLQDCASAREALKKEGYKGSLKVKKGTPVHDKILELQKSRLAGAERIVMHVGTFQEAPYDLQAKAKRGDAQVQINE